MQRKTTQQAGQWATWPAHILSEFQANEPSSQIGHKLIYEDEKYRIWSIRLAAGESIHFHCHSQPYLYTALTCGHSRSYHADGSVHETHYEIGDSENLLDITPQSPHIHNLENLGDSELTFVTTEFLD